MNEYLAELRSLAETKRLVPAELVVMSRLEKIDQLLAQGIVEEDLKNFEDVLLSFFNINEAKIGIQCSLYIADKLLNVYKMMKWNSEFGN